ncbi:MAG TPA: hypothetical protein DD417_14045 [Elusimicrobia bacterium]|nr:hypothetical protein [Elusimicrobiota bacterium]
MPAFDLATLGKSLRRLGADVRALGARIISKLTPKRGRKTEPLDHRGLHFLLAKLTIVNFA